MAYNHGYYSTPPQVAPAYPAYGAPAHQPAYAAYAQPVAAPPPPPVSAAEAFRHFFRSHLATLTFNSRPVINHLTQLALDQTANFENAVVVSEEIAKGIFEALPQHKLPPFYLLDSIAKNFPVPYAALFTRHIPPLFSSAYASVDGTTKSKLEEMLRTWRNGGPKGEPVFGIAVQEELEGRTWGREYVRQMQQQAIFARAAAPAPEPPKAPRALLAQQAQQQQQYAHSPSPYPSAYPPAPPAPVAYYQQQQQQPGRSPLPHPYATPPTVSTTPLPPPPIATGGGLDTNLLSFLSGLLNKAGSNGGASPAPSNPTEGAATPEQQQIQEPEIDEYDEEPDAFERLVLELNVRLENLDLKAKLPRISTIISDHLPQQCRVCGLRAPASARGEKRLATHLDWHYRSNRRTRESEGRGNSRAWFVDAKDWVTDQSTSIDLVPVANGSDPSSSTAVTGSASTSTGVGPAAAKTSATLSAALRAELMKKTIIQPSDPEVAARPCPICKEAFKGDFEEEEEEWVWHNAVEEDGVIYHATCRHDAAKGTTITNQLLAGPPPPAAHATPPPADEAKPDVKPDLAAPEPSPSSNKRKSPDPPSPTPAAQEEDNGGGKRVKLEQAEDAAGQQQPL